jgi:cyclase
LGLGLVALGLLATTSVGRAQERPAPTRFDVADGVWLFRTAPYGDFGLDGNSIAIAGDSAVLVFDTNGTPAAATAVLAEIERLTPLPVRWVVNSHWHWDHWYGTEVYRDAFPNVKVVAQEKTRALMMGPALEFNRPGIEEQLPGYQAMLEKRVADDEAATPQPEELPRLRQTLGDLRFFLAQKENVRLVIPDVAFTDRLPIDLGGRVVEVLNYGRAITPGDAFLWLPDERILVTGDLLIDPVTFALDAYPTEWLDVLERLDDLDARILVPGHGAPMHDETHLHDTEDAIRRVIELGREAKARGLDADSAKEEIYPRLHDVMVRISNDDAQVNAEFKTQFLDWLLHRVYDELDGPLTDSIAPIPPS